MRHAGFTGRRRQNIFAAPWFRTKEVLYSVYSDDNWDLLGYIYPNNKMTGESMTVTAKKRSILFVSLRRDTAVYYLAELQELFKGEVKLATYSFEDQSQPAPRPDATVILAAGPASHARCLDVFPEEKLVLFRRDISFSYYLDQVFLLPPGTRVLVVNEIEETTRETIRQLREKGVDHVEYVPYWEGCDADVSGISVALSPGMFRYCPPGITEKIDMRRRHLSVGTFLELLQRLDLGLDYLERLMEYHSNLLFHTYKRLSEQHARALRLQKTLESILSNMTDAIVFTEDGQIVECNHAAEKLFRCKREYLQGRPLPEILGGGHAKLDAPGASNVLTVNKAKYLCTRTDISANLSPARDARLYTLKAVSEVENMEAHVRKLLYLPQNKAARHHFSDIIAASESMTRVVETAREMARSPLGAAILITGESGTGKELFAQAIHNASSRAKHPFVGVNFGAIPDNLVESELFGYEGGAFTGAHKAGKKGLFELALHGTIFLDEIGNASPWIQARLLRVLEEKELMRLGGTRIIPVDVRVIAATNRDLAAMCREGTFRPDLYHRLNAFPLKIPPLRERKACIREMIAYFLSFHVRKRIFSNEAEERIYQYDWPGNARELKNMIDFLTLKPGADTILPEDLPPDMRAACPKTRVGGMREHTLPLLAGCGSPEILRAVLQLFALHKTRPLGRDRMVGELARQGFPLGESRYRTLVARMAELGLLEKGRTKQGTAITAKGGTLLEVLERG